MTSPLQLGNAGLRTASRSLTAFIEQSPRSGPMAVAAVVGFVTGLAAVLFLELIEFVHWAIRDELFGRALAGLPSWFILFAPAVGGLLVAPLVMRWVPEARGGGVPDVILAVETRGSRIRARVGPGKVVASALTIGSGGSGGTEGPIVQVGATFGSTVGQWFRLSEENTRLLLASGSAAGVAAVYNAPIAGVFFALEVILRRFTARNFSVVVLASVVGTMTAVFFRGDRPALIVPAYGLEQPAEIALYALLGAVAAVAAVAFTRILYAIEARARSQRAIPPMLLPAAGGLLVGVIGLWHSGALGLGDLETDLALMGNLGVETMLLLFVLKIATTTITLGSGGSSGVFRPSLVLGAMLGGAFGVGVNEVFPGATAPSGAYAVVGMAALFAGAARAPITSILIIFEMTRDYHLMLPLMTAVVTATAVASVLDSLNIYTRRLHMMGVHIEEETGASDPMQTLRVRDAMGPITLTFPPDTPLDEVARAFADNRDGVALVLDEDDSVRGVVTNTDVNEALVAGRREVTALDLATTEVRTVPADATLHQALAILAGQSFTTLPVVDPQHPRVPLGILRRSDITDAYAGAVEREDASRRRARLRGSVGEDVRYLDYRVRSQTPAAGRRLRELPLTEDAVVVAVRRGGRTVIPRGNTLLTEGDRVTVIATATAVEAVRALFETDAPDAKS